MKKRTVTQWGLLKAIHVDSAEFGQLALHRYISSRAGESRIQIGGVGERGGVWKEGEVGGGRVGEREGGEGESRVDWGRTSPHNLPIQ